MSTNDHSDQSGLGLHAPSNWLVKNDTGSTLTKLKGVKLDGNDANGRRKVTPITSINDTPLGLVAESIIDGSTGHVLAFDFIVDIDTTIFGPQGTLLYVDSSGDLTIVPGPLGTPNISIGFVHVEDAINGEIFITVAQRGEMGATGPAGSFNGMINGGVSSVSGNTTKAASMGNNSALAGIVAISNGELLGVSIALTVARTGGTCTGSILINGVVQNGIGQEVLIDATNTQSNFVKFVTPIQYVAGDILSLQTTTLGFGPTGSDATITLFLEDV